MTECNQQSFEFEGHFSRQVTARFDGGQQTSDAGGLLLREADRRLNLLSRFAACFVDGRDPNRAFGSGDGFPAGVWHGAGLRRSQRPRATASWTLLIWSRTPCTPCTVRRRLFQFLTRQR